MTYKFTTASKVTLCHDNDGRASLRYGFECERQMVATIQSYRFQFEGGV